MDEWEGKVIHWTNVPKKWDHRITKTNRIFLFSQKSFKLELTRRERHSKFECLKWKVMIHVDVKRGKFSNWKRNTSRHLYVSVELILFTINTIENQTSFNQSIVRCRISLVTQFQFNQFITVIPITFIWTIWLTQWKLVLIAYRYNGNVTYLFILLKIMMIERSERERVAKNVKCRSRM